MQTIKEIYSRIKIQRREQKDLREQLKAELEDSNQYQDILAQIKELKAKKLQFELEVKERLVDVVNKIEDLKASIEADGQLLSTTSLADFSSGKTVEIVEDSGLRLEPNFKVTYRKV
jgi:hypothetical protein